MDSTIRLVAKAITWQIAGFFSMMLIGFLFTGSVVASGGIAVAGMMTGFISYFVHEVAWSKISWGRMAGLADALPNKKALERFSPLEQER